MRRVHLPFEALSDAAFRLTDALTLPTFEADGLRLLKRLTLLVLDARIEGCFCPVFPPDAERITRARVAPRAHCFQLIGNFDRSTQPNQRPPDGSRGRIGSLFRCVCQDALRELGSAPVIKRSRCGVMSPQAGTGRLRFIPVKGAVTVRQAHHRRNECLPS